MLRHARRARPRPVPFVVLLVLAALAISAAILVTVLWAPMQSLAFAPGERDGAVDERHPISLSATHLPAISRLDDDLFDALRRAEADAAADGIRFDITSGWRSREYQQWLLDERIEEWGSEELAREYVATPEGSHHVTGDAVDIAPLDAQIWLIDHGARYGLCQTYANERWHFELATEPGGTCPEMLPDAAG
ncbi:M15 family metallopeptidase [uncultured Microbacterium sp.]|uniref:D-alanyl-D-alanine carboxypeptidase-like core domain-containing protein n=1 Tax=uncultured Microbacterium sp. TaxID=191216 RepID=A0A1Y5P865_9MICO|nr:M15 family metallopeptidase [uncultured Microbacterium sp.]SBS74902.1 exported hypothetical protein [uncultured Microbacterium sp.]